LVPRLLGRPGRHCAAERCCQGRDRRATARRRAVARGERKQNHRGYRDCASEDWAAAGAVADRAAGDCADTGASAGCGRWRYDPMAMPSAEMAAPTAEPPLAEATNERSPSALEERIRSAPPISVETFDSMKDEACAQLRNACDAEDVAAIEAYGERLARSTGLEPHQVKFLLAAEDNGKSALCRAMQTWKDVAVGALGKIINENAVLSGPRPDAPECLRELLEAKWGTAPTVRYGIEGAVLSSKVVIAYGNVLETSRMTLDHQKNILHQAATHTTSRCEPFRALYSKVAAAEAAAHENRVHGERRATPVQ
jgi:hypothetical protein